MNGILRIVEHCDSLLNIVIRYNNVVNCSVAFLKIGITPFCIGTLLLHIGTRIYGGIDYLCAWLRYDGTVRIVMESNLWKHVGFFKNQKYSLSTEFDKNDICHEAQWRNSFYFWLFGSHLFVKQYFFSKYSFKCSEWYLILTRLVSYF